MRSPPHCFVQDPVDLDLAGDTLYGGLTDIRRPKWRVVESAEERNKRVYEDDLNEPT